jgi:hypothetical protein
MQVLKNNEEPVIFRLVIERFRPYNIVMGDTGKLFTIGQRRSWKLFDSNQLTVHQMAMLANPHLPMTMLVTALIVRIRMPVQVTWNSC